ncbi:hypothetical protein Naga_100191g11 [Nannochloropsis gaditana]|uniref:Uncharacterized protein n=1 Tax=Nannochloropsis gaditana TaxID=72520 RepID=W7TSX7_9STRA|nr:hypothetical protein Naga_100191g11 [Nannochloropsis gaditana]
MEVDNPIVEEKSLYQEKGGALKISDYVVRENLLRKQSNCLKRTIEAVDGDASLYLSTHEKLNVVAKVRFVACMLVGFSRALPKCLCGPHESRYHTLKASGAKPYDELHL